MSQPTAAQIGDPLQSVDSPAVLIELDAFKRSVAAMADHCPGRAAVTSSVVEPV
jgi:hypothetical protein